MFQTMFISVLFFISLWLQTWLELGYLRGARLPPAVAHETLQLVNCKRWRNWHMAVYLACLTILSEKTMQTTTILRTGRCIGAAQERKSLWSENHLPLQSSQLKSLYLPVSLSHRLEVRAQVAQAFLGKFQLSSEEMATLRGARDSAITEVITSIMRFNEKNRSASSTTASVRGLVVCGSSVSILWLRGWWMMSLCQRVILAGDE